MIRYVQGVLDYVGDGVGRRGSERWLLSVHEDGTRTLRAHCEMWDTELHRDVVHTVSDAFGPVRSFVSQRLGGSFLGEGWFHFRPGELAAVGVLGPAGDPLDQRFELAARPQFFVPHAVCCDAWIVPAYDIARGGTQRLGEGWRSSPAANGSTGPRAERMGPLGVTLLGQERVSVPAGTFEALHFVVEQDGGLRDELWTTTEDYLLVQLRSDVLRSWYRLRELNVPTGAGDSSGRVIPRVAGRGRSG